MPTPPSFTPVKLEHAEQIELGYLPLRDDFDRVSDIITMMVAFVSLKEFDNDAESSITGLAITDDDDLETGNGYP